MDVDPSTEPLPPNNTAESALPKPPRGGEKEKERDEMEKKMHAGKWRIHETFGVVVCSSALTESGGEHNKEACRECLGYIRHIGGSVAVGDKGLKAAMKLRDLATYQCMRLGDSARLEGQMSATKIMLTASEEKLERTQSSLLTVTAKLAAAEEENNHLAGERDDARDECDAANEEIARLKIEIHGLESQIDKMDDSRARKRPTPPVCTLKGKPKIQVASAARTTQQTGPDIPQAVTVGDDDVKMADVAIEQRAPFDWKKAPEEHLWYYRLLKAPGIPAEWAFHRIFHRGMLFMHIHMHMNLFHPHSWPFTTLHRHVLINYEMPLWFWTELKRSCGQKDVMEKNLSWWSSVNRPKLGDPLITNIAYCQFSGRRPQGFRFSDIYGTIDSRQFRGALLFQAINLAPLSKRKDPWTQEERDARIAMTKALFYILAIPGGYAQELRTYQCQVAPVQNLEHWPIGETNPEDLADGKVVSKLSAMGLSISTVDDMYPFLRGYIDMLIDLSREGWDIEFLKAVRTAANDALTRVGEPAGITATYADMLVHPPGLPWNDSALNAQNRGTLLNAVRLAAGEVGMVNHSSISSPDSQPTASTSRDRGRGKPRGGARVVF
ncbi:hypothetical protein R3P38DRAFT_2771038 [Favolaschia claudopus]|uniref:Uncharacterized protein n=1 Tax=Favolaschia claudopus TaxID=2862362 RepID=A0AAW0CGB2_9AGAR